MAEESAQERTEKATPKRLQDARDKGQVARSRELNSAALVLLGALGLWLLGERVGGAMQALLHDGLSMPRARLPSTSISPLRNCS